MEVGKRPRETGDFEIVEHILQQLAADCDLLEKVSSQAIIGSYVGPI